MNTPNVSLMRAYGTDANFKEKTANVAPIARRIAEIALGRGLLERRIQSDHHTARHTMQAEMMNTAFRVMELARMEQAIDNANHSNAPIILPSSYGQDLPLGMTEGMIRMASAAAEHMAKTAGPFRTPGLRAPVPATAAAPAAAAAAGHVVPGGDAVVDGAQKFWKRTGLSGGKWKYKVPALAAAGAATLGGLAVLKKVKNWASEEVPERPYRNGGNQLAPDINQHGYAQPVAPNY